MQYFQAKLDRDQQKYKNGLAYWKNCLFVYRTPPWMAPKITVIFCSLTFVTPSFCTFKFLLYYLFNGIASSNFKREGTDANIFISWVQLNIIFIFLTIFDQQDWFLIAVSNPRNGFYTHLSNHQPTHPPDFFPHHFKLWNKFSCVFLFWASSPHSILFHTIFNFAMNFPAFLHWT